MLTYSTINSMSSSSTHPLVSMLAACDEDRKLTELQMVNEVVEELEKESKCTENTETINTNTNSKKENNTDMSCENVCFSTHAGENKEIQNVEEHDVDDIAETVNDDKFEEHANSEEDKNIQICAEHFDNIETEDTDCFKSVAPKRLSSPERIRQHALRLACEIHKLSSRHSTRHARHFSRSCSIMQHNYSESSCSSINGSHNARQTEHELEEDENGEFIKGPPTFKRNSRVTNNLSYNSFEPKRLINKRSSGQQLLRLPDLNKCFEESRDRHLKAAQENRVVFPPIKQSITFSEKNPDAFSLRFQSKTDSVQSPLRLIKDQN